MRELYQMDLFDLEDRALQPVNISNPLQVARVYVCPKCRDYVGMYEKEGRAKGWHDVKDVCRNGHRMNWEAIRK